MKKALGFIALGALIFLCAIAIAILYTASNWATMPRVSGVRVQQGWSVVRVFGDSRNPPVSFNPCVSAWNDVIQRTQQWSIGDAVVPTIRFASPNGVPLFSDGDSSDTIGYTFEWHTAEGDIIPLKSRGVYRDNFRVPNMVDCEVPSAPATCHYLDLTIRKGDAIQACWRIRNLPKLQHIALRPATSATISPVPDLFLNAFAQWSTVNPTYVVPVDYGAFACPYQIRIIWRDASTQTPSNAYWILANCQLYSEWTEDGILNSGVYDSAGKANSSDSNEFHMTGTAPPYRNVPQNVQINGVLEQHAGLSETVTFPNVPIVKSEDHWALATPPKGLVQYSRNGITVTLLPESQAQRNDRAGRSDSAGKSNLAVSYRFTVSPLGRVRPIAGLPLFEPHHLPVSVIAYLGADSWWVARNESPAPMLPIVSGTLFFTRSPGQLRTCDLRVVINEDTLLQTVPFTFTVPIEQALQ